MRRYKFTIAFENQSYPGYVTEKIADALMAGTVPIYWGARMFPKNLIRRRLLIAMTFPILIPSSGMSLRLTAMMNNTDVI